MWGRGSVGGGWPGPQTSLPPGGGGVLKQWPGNNGIPV